MDAGKIFVLILSAISIGFLVYLEIKSRQASKLKAANPLPEPKSDGKPVVKR